MVYTNCITFLVLIFLSVAIARTVIHRSNDGSYSEYHEEHGPAGGSSFQSVSSRMGPGVSSIQSSTNFVSSGNMPANRMMDFQNTMHSMHHHHMQNPAFSMLRSMFSGMLG